MEKLYPDFEGWSLPNACIMASNGCKAWPGSVAGSYFWYGLSVMMTPGLFLADMVIKMKHEHTSKPFVPDPEQMAAALDAAPDSANYPDCPYDAKDANAVAAFWAQGKVRLPGQRGPQKRPTILPEAELRKLS